MSLPLRHLQYLPGPLQRRLGDVVHALSGAIAIRNGNGVVGYAMLSLAARAMRVRS